MRHARDKDLDRIDGLLAQMRTLPGLKEKTRGVFYLKSRAALHFHEDPAGLFADVRGPGDLDFDRLKVDTAEGARALVARLRTQLGAG